MKTAWDYLTEIETIIDCALNELSPDEFDHFKRLVRELIEGYSE